QADLVYITYTGTVASGFDTRGVFGQVGDLRGKSFEVDYVFNIAVSDENFAFGGSAFNKPTPLVGAAVLTIGTSIVGRGYRRLMRLTLCKSSGLSSGLPLLQREGRRKRLSVLDFIPPHGTAAPCATGHPPKP